MYLRGSVEVEEGLERREGGLGPGCVQSEAALLVGEDADVEGGEGGGGGDGEGGEGGPGLGGPQEPGPLLGPREGGGGADGAGEPRVEEGQGCQLADSHC